KERARLRQLREMGAGGLRRDSRRKGKLGRRQATAIEKRRNHCCCRRVSDQRGDLGDDRACNHRRYLTPESVNEHFDSDRSGLPAAAATALRTESRDREREEDELFLGRGGDQPLAGRARGLRADL